MHLNPEAHCSKAVPHLGHGFWVSSKRHINARLLQPDFAITRISRSCPCVHALAHKATSGWIYYHLSKLPVLSGTNSALFLASIRSNTLYQSLGIYR